MFVCWPLVCRGLNSEAQFRVCAAIQPEQFVECGKNVLMGLALIVVR